MIEIIRVYPIIDYSVRGLCIRPYYNHTRGCPNFGMKKRCPPQAPLFDKFFDMEKPFYAIINTFDLGSHVKKMKEKHPKWSDKQYECCLYWQKGVTNELLEEAAKFACEHIGEGYLPSMCPEAMGINVTETLKNAGIVLEWPPKKFVRKVAIMGVKR